MFSVSFESIGERETAWKVGVERRIECSFRLVSCQIQRDLW